jgi:hypothetical protein
MTCQTLACHIYMAAVVCKPALGNLGSVVVVNKDSYVSYYVGFLGLMSAQYERFSYF